MKEKHPLNWWRYVTFSLNDCLIFHWVGQILLYLGISAISIYVHKMYVLNNLIQLVLLMFVLSEATSVNAHTTHYAQVEVIKVNLFDIISCIAQIILLILVFFETLPIINHSKIPL